MKRRGPSAQKTRSHVRNSAPARDGSENISGCPCGWNGSRGSCAYSGGVSVPAVTAVSPDPGATARKSPASRSIFDEPGAASTIATPSASEAKRSTAEYATGAFSFIFFSRSRLISLRSRARIPRQYTASCARTSSPTFARSADEATLRSACVARRWMMSEPTAQLVGRSSRSPSKSGEQKPVAGSVLICSSGTTNATSRARLMNPAARRPPSRGISASLNLSAVARPILLLAIVCFSFCVAPFA